MIDRRSHPDSLREALEAAGLRCTPQRQAVFAVLCRAEDHPTAEEVFLGVRGMIPNVSLATVYKALETLVECGLATRLLAAEGTATGVPPARYDARGDHHYHARCLRSGTVLDLETPYDPGLIDRLDPSLAARLQAEGFHVTGYRLEVIGYLDSERDAETRRDSST